MLFTRWKVMTGLVGVSIAGLAAFAAQGTKPESATVQLPTVPVTPMPTKTPPPIVDASPSVLPLVPAGATTPPKPPVELPAIPEMKPPVKPESVLPPKADGPSSTVPPVISGTIPDLPATPSTPQTLPSTPPSTPKPSPVTGPPAGAALPPSNDAFAAPSKGAPPTTTLPPDLSVDPLVGTQKATARVESGPPAAAPAQTKFRIVLRVGEGEPSFEVRHGDDLVMKVTCDKVDIKSPEKGPGLSNVTATGKVRFVGFGAEGTCDSLSFLAGLGEVALAGNVNVKVRDKIGRVESELNADKMQYKLDQTALSGVLKP